MTQTPTLTGLDIGEAQRAVGAVLDALLAEAGTSFVTWVTVNTVATSPAPPRRDELIARLAAGLKTDPAAAEAAVAGAESSGLVHEPAAAGGADGRLVLTPAGQDLHGRLSGAIARVTPELYGGIPPADLATAHRVLRRVIDRANAYLAR